MTEDATATRQPLAENMISKWWRNTFFELVYVNILRDPQDMWDASQICLNCLLYLEKQKIFFLEKSTETEKISNDDTWYLQ